MARDKTYGAIIFIVSLLIILYYTYWVPIKYALPAFTLPFIPTLSWEWGIIIPVWIGVLGVFGIMAWVGWTMLTTPTQVPIEEPPQSEPEKKEE